MSPCKCGCRVRVQSYRVSGQIQMTETDDPQLQHQMENTGMWDSVRTKRVGRARCWECNALLPKETT